MGYKYYPIFGFPIGSLDLEMSSLTENCVAFPWERSCISCCLTFKRQKGFLGSNEASSLRKVGCTQRRGQSSDSFIFVDSIATKTLFSKSFGDKHDD